MTTTTTNNNNNDDDDDDDESRQNAERAGLQGASPLVSFNHVTDPHFVTFSSNLYTTIRNPNPNPTVITDLQVGPRAPQIVRSTPQIRPLCICAHANNDHNNNKIEQQSFNGQDSWTT